MGKTTPSRAVRSRRHGHVACGGKLTRRKGGRGRSLDLPRFARSGAWLACWAFLEDQRPQARERATSLDVLRAAPLPSHGPELDGTRHSG